MKPPGSAFASQVALLLKRYDAKRILMVTGKRSFSLCGAEAALTPVVQGAKLSHFNDFSPNPTLEEVEAGALLWRSEKPDVVLGIGGGSALDLAKLINGVAESKASVRDILTGQSPPEGTGVPVIAVPTTSGSGAEVTHFAAVYVDRKKYSVTHESLRPTHCIHDPSLTRSLSRYLTAATGMDALSQAIESYWSVLSTEESRKLFFKGHRVVRAISRECL